MTTSRRSFLAKSILATAGLPFAATTLGRNTGAIRYPQPPKAGPMTIHVFSKVFQWLDYREMAAESVKAGFDGIELTVRPGGHVLPERVAEDLPRAADIIRKAGLKIDLICTAIVKAEDPFTEPILKTASTLGIEQYRMGVTEYAPAQGTEANLERIKKIFTSLASLNGQYRIKGNCQNHSGAYFASPVWDLAQVLQELQSPWLGCQYDIHHAVVEGAYSWPLGFNLIRPYINTINIKDFIWQKNPEGRWGVQDVPLGDGMVDFKKYFALLKENNIRVPVSLHYEYPLGGAEHGKKTILMPKEEVLKFIRADVATLKNLLG